MTPAQIPPGQVVTQRFPVVGERAPHPAALDLEAWRLEVGGEVQHPLTLTYAEVLALPQRELVADIHCVTGWSRLGTRFQGTPLAILLDRVRPRSEASFVRFEAFTPRAHDTSLPLERAHADTWLVHACDGAPLAVEHGFPLRTVTPSRYFYKSLKWVRRIELLAEDRLGYWERESGYHNTADPWPGNQRFTTGSIDPQRLARFRSAADYAPWRGRVLLGVDLRGWSPRTRDLRDLQLKDCDLRGALLSQCDLRGANLSLSDLRGADLDQADLRGADLEGANLAGADLRGADLSGSALCATRFFERQTDGSTLAAQVDGMRRDGARGLLEDQEAFLGRPGGGG